MGCSPVHSIDTAPLRGGHHLMARLARVVIPGHPHHVTERGNGGARTVFSEHDYAL